MPHGTKLELVKLNQKKFEQTNKNVGGHVVHLPSHDTTGKLHMMDSKRKKKIIKDSYVSPLGNEGKLSQSSC